MKVEIKNTGKKGWITYDPKSKSLKVKLADVRKRKQIISYLNKPQAFRIPVSTKNLRFALLKTTKTWLL